MVKRIQNLEGKNPTFFFTFSHPDWFLPYIPQVKTNNFSVSKGAKEPKDLKDP